MTREKLRESTKSAITAAPEDETHSNIIATMLSSRISTSIKTDDKMMTKCRRIPEFLFIGYFHALLHASLLLKIVLYCTHLEAIKQLKIH